LPLLAAERVEGMAIIAGCPASAMALPEEVISDWLGRAGSREKLREIPLMFAVKPDMALIDEYADDAAKVSRHALEATLRVLLTSFEERLNASPPTCASGSCRKVRSIARPRLAKSDCRQISREQSDRD
jgi:hypothetical protein